MSEFETWVHESVPSVADALLASGVRTAKITFEQADDLPVGSTRFGGLPDLAAGESWPTDSEGRLIPFIGQLDLSTFPVPVGLDLPADGVLAFFYNDDDAAASLHPEGSGATVRWFRGPLERAADGDVALAECRLITDEIWSYDYQWDDVSDDEESALEEIVDHLESGPAHRVGGVAIAIQHPVLFEIAAASLDCYRRSETACWDEARQQAKDWVLLLQVDSDEDLDVEWGDAGIVSFAIRQTDLAHRRFENARVNFQCQ